MCGIYTVTVTHTTKDLVPWFDHTGYDLVYSRFHGGAWQHQHDILKTNNCLVCWDCEHYSKFHNWWSDTSGEPDTWISWRHKWVQVSILFWVSAYLLTNILLLDEAKIMKIIIFFWSMTPQGLEINIQVSVSIVLVCHLGNIKVEALCCHWSKT